ncbi:MAG: pseudouridine synthase [Saprospiraceae bacterium]|nr:pseudouridine synthase [Saprospiraceae bacterium]
MEAKVKSDTKYFVFYKPYNVLNQFTKEQPEHVTLADFLKVDKDVYPVGRLDKDSEGLLILTNDKSINSLLLSPSQHHKRSYFVQVDNDITDQAIEKIKKGVEIKLDSGEYKTKSCTVKKLYKPPLLPERNPPIRVRQHIPTSWALIELTEGKNRQVRKMFAAVGFPVLRLIRVQIEDLKLGKLEPGKYIEIKAEELFKLLKIDPAATIKKKTGPRREFTFGSRSKSTEKELTEKNIKKPDDKFGFRPRAKSNEPATEKPAGKKSTEKPKKEPKPFTKNKPTSKEKPFRKKEEDKSKKSYFKR